MNRPDFTVANLGELATLHVAEIKEGANVWVAGDGTYWTLEKNSGAALSLTVIAPLSGSPSAGAGNARWIRSTIAPGVLSTSSVIYRAGAVAPSPPVFATFAEAVTALNTTGGGGQILIDGALAQPQVTAGAYDLFGITLAGTLIDPTTYTTLDILNGATFTNGPTRIRGNLTLNSKSNAPVIVSSSMPLDIIVEEFSWLYMDPASSAPFCHVQNGHSVYFLCNQGVLSAGGTVNRVVQCDAGGNCVINLGTGSFVDTNTVTGAGSIQINGYSISSSVKAQAGALALSQRYGNGDPTYGLFELDLTLIGGTKTVASGKDLTHASLIGIKLKTPLTAVGSNVVGTFVAGANGNVTLTSYGPTAAQLATDVSTYTAVFLGAV